MNKKRGYIIKKDVFMYLVMILAILFAAPGNSMRAYAMTPRVMMTDYSLDKKDIYPGDTFSLSFKLKNTSKNTVMNLKCVVVSDKGEFLPSEGVGSSYVDEIVTVTDDEAFSTDEIAGEEEIELTFKLEAVKKLEEKTYSLKVKTEYEDWSGSYKSEDSVYVPIKLKTEVLVSDTYIAEEEIHLGDNIEIVSTVNNIGAADTYKVTAQVTGHNIADSKSYIGNIKPGKNANIDIITKAIKHDDVRDATEYDNDLIITYEDIDGNKYTEKESLGNIKVLEQDFSDIIQIIIAAAVVLIIIFFVRRHLKRKKLERNFD